MLLILASAVPLHWNANMLLINGQMLSSISSDRMPLYCCCIVKCWNAILKQTIAALAAYAAS